MWPYEDRVWPKDCDVSPKKNWQTGCVLQCIVAVQLRSKVARHILTLIHSLRVNISYNPGKDDMFGKVNIVILSVIVIYAAMYIYIYT